MPKTTRTIRRTPPASREEKSDPIPGSTLSNDAHWSEVLFLCRLALNAPESDLEENVSSLFGMRKYTKALGLSRSKAKTHEARWRLLESRMEALASQSPSEGIFTRNLRSLSETLGLTSAGTAVLRHAILIGSGNFILNQIDNVCDGSVGFSAVMDRLADAWGIDAAGWHEAIGPTAPLVRCGIVQLELDTYSSDDMIRMDKQLARSLRCSPGALDRLLESFLDKAPPRLVGSEDFTHLESFRGPLVEALRSGVSSETPPHILLSGPPGTGKSQFAMFLAAEAGLRPLLAQSEDPSGAALSGQTRRTALGLSRHTLGSKPENVLIVDEAENLLEQDAWSALVGRQSAPSPAKAWTNRFLEAPGTPMVWIVNSPEVLDPSILRRFTWHVPFRNPVRSVRRRILDRHLATHALPEAFLEELAERDDLPPHEAARLARIARHVPGGQSTESVLRLALASTDRILGRRPPHRVEHATTFDPSLLNTDVPVAAILDGMGARGFGRLGFFGPPGTGKSMLASEIAKRTGRPLHVKDGSDFLSKWVGETEERIAEAFQEAVDESAVLFLDEIDGLAVDRDRSRNSWERTMVNELLVRLERFPGIAILATNSPDSLDAAVLRRLDVKVEFGSLSKLQAWALLLRHTPAATVSHRHRLDLLDLRLGDFGAALRGLSVQGLKIEATSLVTALEAEVDFRDTRSRPRPRSDQRES